LVGQQNRGGYIIKQVFEEREEADIGTMGSECFPDDVAVNSVICRLDVKEGDNCWAPLALSLHVHQFVETQRLVHGTSLWSKSALC
jgi:hypothetical protein